MSAQEERSVWHIEEGEIRRPGIIHVVMTALFTGIGIVVGTLGSLAVPIGFVSAFWPGQAVRSSGASGLGGGVGSPRSCSRSSPTS
jgi:hypothetical protein